MKSKVDLIVFLSKPMLLEILVEIVLIWAFHVTFSSIITPKNLVTVSLSRVMPSRNSYGNFVGMKRFLEVR